MLFRHFTRISLEGADSLGVLTRFDSIWTVHGLKVGLVFEMNLQRFNTICYVHKAPELDL